MRSAKMKIRCKARWDAKAVRAIKTKKKRMATEAIDDGADDDGNDGDGVYDETTKNERK